MRNVLDLFSGAAGGWSLGMHRAGYETIAACEIDPWRREQYRKNNPTVRIYDDVRTLTADRLYDAGLFPDIVVGSPPCQDISSANHNGKGVDGDRSGLFFEALRIIREVRPVWGCLENSPNLRNRGSDRILGYLDAIGYACWPLVVGAKDVGANHIRRRVWLVFADAARQQVGRAGQSREETARVPADAERCALREQPRGCRGTNGTGEGIAVADGSHADRQGQHAGTEDATAVARSACSCGNASNPPGVRRGARTGSHLALSKSACSGTGFGHSTNSDETRLALGQGVGRNDGAECSSSERNGVSFRHHWAASAPDFGGVDARFSEELADFCYSSCAGDYGWLIREIQILKSIVTIADSVLDDEDLANALKILAASREDSIAQKAAQTALSCLRKQAIANGPCNFAATCVNTAEALSNFIHIIGTKTLLTTIRETYKRSAPVAICAITGKRSHSDRNSCAAVNSASRACISAYGDAVVPQIPEIIGRAMRRIFHA